MEDRVTLVDSTHPIRLDLATNAITVSLDKEMAATTYAFESTTTGLQKVVKEISLTINLQDYSGCDASNIEETFPLI